VHNEEFHKFDYPFSIIRMRCVEHIARTVEVRNAHKLYLKNVKGRDHFGRHSHRWENDIKIYFKLIGYEEVYWIHPVQERNG
jgi:hypothetical protein